MRRIVMFNNVSADGYFARPDGSLDWVVPDPELDRAAMAGPGNFDTVLFGRRTYELFASFWPQALSDPPAPERPGHIPRKLTPETHRMAIFLDNATKLVFSRTLTNPSWKNTQVVRELDPERVESLKNSKGGDMLIFGSGTIVTLLTLHRLIDEYQFAVRPVLLGDGRSVLRGVRADLSLELLEARSFRAATVLLRYAPAK